MSATYARSDFNGDDLHQRDGSLIRKKREQWAKERAEVDSWFPFGSPGGGAPNKKYEVISPVHPDKPENRPSSCRSNGDSGRWSDSENVGPNKEIPERVNHRSEFTYPYMAASTSSSASTVYIPARAQLPDGGAFHGLPHIAAPSGTFVASANGSIPIQLVCPPMPYGQSMPVPIEFAQTQPGPFPVVYPLRLLSSTSAGCSTSQGGLEERKPDLQTMNSYYTEQWASQLPYWGNTTSYKDDPLSPKEAAPIAFPPLSAAQPLAVVKPMVIPLVAPSQTEQPYSTANPSGSDDIAHGSMSESSTSLNSSCRRGSDSEGKGRAALSERAINEQIAEKQREEARRLEEDRREALKKENERRRMEEQERNKQLEEERRKKEAEEEQRRKEEAVQDAIEKAKQEAEKLRKARIYKHVLEDRENSADLERSILGYDIATNVKILKEVESLERQKKYESQIFENKQKNAAKKKDEGATTSERQRRFLDDERPIKPPSGMNHTYSGFSHDVEPVNFNRKGRMSLRVPNVKKAIQKPRTNSLERRSPERSKEPQPSKPSVRRPVLNCSIPVRPQRRIPPPSARSRRTSINESEFVTNTPTSNETEVVSLEAYPTSYKPLNKHSSEKKETRKGNSVELCSEYLFPATSATDHNAVDVPELKPISLTPIRSVRSQRSSHDALLFLSDIPGPEDNKTSPKRRTSNRGEDSFFQNPLFQPVATRCRRSRVSMDKPEAFSATSCTTPGSETPLSSEENSSPVSNVKGANELKENNSDVISKAETGSFTNVMGVNFVTGKSLMNDGDTVYSPFKKKLANTSIFNRHREEELLSPEIKRKGEYPSSSSLRSSLANLSVDGSEEGRISPVCPLLQRFNSKTSQYRSLNLKKTSERNQKVLERLAEIRSRLPHSTDRDSCKKNYFSRTPHQSVMQETSRKSTESVTAI